MKRPGTSSQPTAGQGTTSPSSPQTLRTMTVWCRWTCPRSSPMIALPFHPSNAFTIEELNANLHDILHQTDEDNVQQLVGRKDVEAGPVQQDRERQTAGGPGRHRRLRRRHCSTASMSAAAILKGHTGGCGDYALSVYPGSQPIMHGADPQRRPSTDLMASRRHHPHLRSAAPASALGTCPPTGHCSIRHYHPQLPQPRGLQARQTASWPGWH